MAAFTYTMNANTKHDFKKFLEAVQELAAGVVHQIGSDSAARICEAAEKLKVQLDKDETIQ